MLPEVPQSHNTRYVNKVGVSAVELHKSYSTTCQSYIANTGFRNICHTQTDSDLFETLSLIFKKRVNFWLLQLYIDNSDALTSEVHRQVTSDRERPAQKNSPQ